MADPDVPLRRYLVAGTLVVAPAALAIAVIVFAGRTDTPTILIAAGAAVVLAGLVVRPYLRGLARFARFVDTLAADREPGEARFVVTPAIAELAGAAATLTAGW